MQPMAVEPQNSAPTVQVVEHVPGANIAHKEHPIETPGQTDPRALQSISGLNSLGEAACKRKRKFVTVDLSFRFPRSLNLLRDLNAVKVLHNHKTNLDEWKVMTRAGIKVCIFEFVIFSIFACARTLVSFENPSEMRVSFFIRPNFH